MIDKRRQRWNFILGDFVASNVAWCIFNLIRYYTLPYNYSSMTLHQYYAMDIVLLGQIIFPLMMVALYAVSGFYNNVFFKSRMDELVNSFGISLIGAVIIFFVALFNDNIDDRLKNYEMFIILWLLISTATAVPRLFITSNISRLINNKSICFNTLIIGTDHMASKLFRQLSTKYRKMGLNVVGFVSSADSDISDTTEFNGLPVYSLNDVQDVIADNSIEAFIIAHDNKNAMSTVETINLLFPTGKSIYITPDTLHFVTSRPRTRTISGEVLIDVTKSTISPSTLNIKRISDILVSAIALVVLSPVLLAISIAVRRGSPGGAIYKQERIGLKKKPFFIYKFRTMYTDSEANGPALSSSNDTRITPQGHFLRKYRLDELPQFWNVLKGDMSLVGPRPEREFYLKQIIEREPYFSLLHQVRPGITSWGMVKYGYAMSVDQMIERGKFDLLYIENVSLIVDMKILFYTIETVITGKGV